MDHLEGVLIFLSSTWTPRRGLIFYIAHGHLGRAPLGYLVPREGPDRGPMGSDGVGVTGSVGIGTGPVGIGMGSVGIGWGRMGWDGIRWDGMGSGWPGWGRMGSGGVGWDGDGDGK